VIHSVSHLLHVYFNVFVHKWLIVRYILSNFYMHILQCNTHINIAFNRFNRCSCGHIHQSKRYFFNVSIIHHIFIFYTITGIIKYALGYNFTILLINTCLCKIHYNSKKNTVVFCFSIIRHCDKIVQFLIC